MDSASIASTIAAVLPTALPYLLKLGKTMADTVCEEAAKKAGEQLGPETWEAVKSIWSRIGERLLGKPAGKEAVDDVVEQPSNSDTIAALRNQIRKLLEEDPELKAELEPIVQKGLVVHQRFGKLSEGDVMGVRYEGDTPPSAVEVRQEGEEVTKSTFTGIDIKKI